MNMLSATSGRDPFGYRVLVLDLNSFFASCEQQENPKLRGRPVAVVPVMTDTTCAIAASYPAKDKGVKTGTLIWQAKKMCPELICVPSRPKLYVEYHKRILATIQQSLPLEDVMSIDEVACRLDKRQRTEEAARALGQKLKKDILEQVGECLTSSVGIAPNKMLAKLASNLQKPDGLTLLGQQDLPKKILSLPLTAFPGIGANMESRLLRAGISTMQELWQADAQFLRRVWGGIGGLKFHELLHGREVSSAQTQRRSIGHQHVLDPVQRSKDLAWPVMRQLVIRAGARLRREGLFTSNIGIEIKWMGDLGCYADKLSLPETQNTAALLKGLEKLWKAVPAMKPLRVGIILQALKEEEKHQFDLFEKKPPANLAHAIDELNGRFGTGTVMYGAEADNLTAKIAFQRVPDEREF